MVEALGPEDPAEVAGYRLRGRLGEGGMGAVYLAHSRGGQPMALKVIRREFARDPEFLRRFAREVDAARRVQGPYTAAVVDSSVEGPRPWLASQYVPGPSLSQAVARHGPLPLRTVLSLAAGIAEALQSVHRVDVVHRDLKPSNVLLAADGPRVIDFGIARALDATALTGTDVRLGTPGYMAPEQVSGQTAGPALDVFALGLVVFYAASGGHPFGEGGGAAMLYRIVEQEPDLTDCPEQLVPLIRGCLAKDPGQRPGLDAFIDACNGVAQANGITLLREAGRWLPPAVAEAAGTAGTAAAEAAPPDTAPTAAAAPAEPPVPPESTFPLGRRAPYTPTVHEPDPPPRKRSRGRLVGIGLAALAVLAGGTLVAMKLLGSSSDGPKESPGWTITKKSVPLTIPAPHYTTHSGWANSGNTCDSISDGAAPPTSVYVSLKSFEAFSRQKDMADSKAQADRTIRYTDCADGSFNMPGKGGGAGPTSGFKLLDGRGKWGLVEKHDSSAEDCRRSARSGALPNKISIKQIQRDSVLQEGKGLCVLAPDEKTVTLLWITKVTPQPKNDKLREYDVELTRWKPSGDAKG
ncbi:serine/threonine-protein kinase [Streptomyces sp. NPDC048172]|uniref:serine/threonine-protein kinase n=1 Tax=Streptomyces sp. NPDC048172 TaxID=3365505 RepID=UPI00371B4878